MNKRIIKRNGETVDYEPFKIKDAIEKAFRSVQQSIDDEVFFQVFILLDKKAICSVEEIQDAIEYQLFERGYFKVLKSFMLYRHTHKLQR